MDETQKEEFQKKLRLEKAVAIYEVMQEVFREQKDEIVRRIKLRYDKLGAQFLAEDEAKVKL